MNNLDNNDIENMEAKIISLKNRIAERITLLHNTE